MDLRLLLVSLFCLYVSADRNCADLGFAGQCVLLDQCESLRSLLQESKSKAAVFETLKKLTCGFENTDPKVCCPSPEINTFTEITNGKSCVTVAGEAGTCAKLEECSHMNEKLQTKGFVFSENMEYVKRSNCTPPGSTKSFYVCCKFDVDDRGRDPEDRILDSKCAMTAFPPQPGSECCGIEGSSDSRIIGGKEAGIDQFPWLVMIEYTRIGYSCGGSLISGRYVLTAAHCLVGPKKKDRGAISVRLGEYNTTNPGSDCVETAGGGMDCTDGDISIPIETFVAHEGYEPENVLQYHDIALIRLKELAPYTDFIRPICLPTTDFSLSAPDDLRLFISGWGIADEAQQFSSEIKLFAKVPYVRKEQCNERYSKFSRQHLIDTQLCVGGEAKRDSCKGDSGGPLMLLRDIKYEAAGVVSFGTKSCGLENWPSIYTKVYDYLDWIRDTIKP